VAFIPLKIGAKEIEFHKAIVAPKFDALTVLVSDPWDFVEMQLKKSGKDDPLFYWQQARHFFNATIGLPKVASPLTSYYCFLNAAKALLVLKGIVSNTERHGVSGAPTGTRVALINETVRFHPSGTLSALCNYLGESTKEVSYSLKDIFYNLPYIHRAYRLTFGSQPELFFSIASPRYVRKARSAEAWFCAEIVDAKLTNERTINKLPKGFERDRGDEKKWIIRRKKRFVWKQGNAESESNIARLAEYHKQTRCNIQYIHGPLRLWYFKRGGVTNGLIPRSTLTLTYAAMHRLSEIARYNPPLLAKHFERPHNWLLSEFLATAPYQFCDEIAAEITGQDFLIPGTKFVS